MNEMDKRGDTQAAQSIHSGSLSIVDRCSEDDCEAQWVGIEGCAECTKRRKGNLVIGLYALIAMAVLFGICTGMVVSGIVDEWGDANGVNGATVPLQMKQGENNEQGSQTN